MMELGVLAYWVWWKAICFYMDGTEQKIIQLLFSISQLLHCSNTPSLHPAASGIIDWSEGPDFQCRSTFK